MGLSLERARALRLAAGGWREGFAFGLGLTALFALQVWKAGPTSLFDGHLWLDEIYTCALVNDASLAHSMRALAAGVETHPPGLYILLRPLAWFSGGLDATLLRLSALVSVELALVGLFLCLRTRYAVGTSIVGALSIWCNPTIVQEAFDGRFYGPLLAAVVWYACGLMRSREGAGGWYFVTVFSAVMAASVHYLGIAAVVLVTGGEIYARRKAGLPVLPALVGGSSGLLGLAACLPFLLGQRRAISQSTWLEPITLRLALNFLAELFWMPLAFVLFLGVWTVLRYRSGPARAGRDFAGLTALLALPFVLILVSVTAQPVYLPRYAIPAVAGCAPLSAWAASRLRPLGLGICILILSLFSGLAVRTEALRQKSWSHSIDWLIHVLRQRPESEPIVFESPAQAYVVDRYANDLRKRSYLLDFEDDEIGNINRNRLFMRDLSRQYASFYAGPAMVPWRTARGWPQFILVGAQFVPVGRRLVTDSDYPGFQVTRVTPPEGLDIYFAQKSR
jgi:hypothetical protein